MPYKNPEAKKEWDRNKRKTHEWQSHHAALGKAYRKAWPERMVYFHAKARCTNPKDGNWPRYGARGIKFLFTSFEQFFAELGPRPEGKEPGGKALYSVDRFPNNAGHYEPGNVRWATRKQQNENQRSHGRQKTITVPA
jgi:hypothetical protein